MVRLFLLVSFVGILQSSLAAQFIEPAPAKPGSDNYVLGPDSKPQDGVPKGNVTQHQWTTSKIYPNTVRDYWVYVPAQYDGSEPAAVMVFLDGQAYVNVTARGEWRVPDVFDNLIHKKEMPVTIGIFISPGRFAEGNRSNRSFEYDTLSDQYARFLLDEILPEVGKSFKLTNDPEKRAIAGLSSGAICAFTVAWERPDEFRKVASFYGSYTGIAYRPARNGNPMQMGGDMYPGLIRRSPPKPLKIFLQDGSADLNNNQGNWFLANQQMLSSLEFANSQAGRGGRGGRGGGRRGGGRGPVGNAADATPTATPATASPSEATTPSPTTTSPAVQPSTPVAPATTEAVPAAPPIRYVINHAWGDGGHTAKHGGSIFPDVMRWLWEGVK